MWLHLLLDCIALDLRITGYRPIDHDWCKVDLRLRASFLDYAHPYREILDGYDIEEWRDTLRDFLDGKKWGNLIESSLLFSEPDMDFTYHFGYLAEGRLNIALYDKRGTRDSVPNRLDLFFNLQNLERLWRYLCLISGEIPVEDSRIASMLADGTLLMECEESGE